MVGSMIGMSLVGARPTINGRPSRKSMIFVPSTLVSL
jgi:hypothetical protein